MEGSQSRGSRGEEERDARLNRQVNSLLNTLRGEQYRHAQNVRAKQERIGVARTVGPLTSNKPTLPLSQIFGIGSNDGEEPVVSPAPFRPPGQTTRRPPVTLIEGVPTYMYPDGAVPGPKPPKSWNPLFSAKGDESAWRARALSLLLSHLPSTPAYLSDETSSAQYLQPLTLVCMRTLLAACGSAEELAEVAAYVPAHLRRDLMRWCAVYKPLDTVQLRALCAGEGHADGELIVVGPQASLRVDFLSRRQHLEQGLPHTHEERDSEEHHHLDEDWDTSPSFDTHTPLTALTLITAPLSINTLLSLPRILTHLALLKLPQPAPIHNLPSTCPHLEVLDLSYNTWLKTEESASMSSAMERNSFNRIEWKRWRNLRVLGLRECGVRLGKEVMRKVNEGRMADIEIIGVDIDPYLWLSDQNANKPAPG